jgi:glycerol-3-phosphate acyltransferase PlsX
MKVAVDLMGGDQAPMAIYEGALLAARELDIRIVLVGLPDAIRRTTKSGDPFEYIEAQEAIGMDESAAAAAHAKRRSSMHICAELVRDKKVDAWVSAGNSGAILATSLLVQGRIHGVQRPAIGTVFPTLTSYCYMLDVGANADCKPEYLLSFGLMGNEYAKKIMRIDVPRVGILSIGEEAGKGNELVKQATALFQDDKRLNFVGNVEPKEIFYGKADVVVTDGFTGNVALKMGEATAEMFLGMMRDVVRSSLLTMVGGFMLSSALRKAMARVDWRKFGGAPLLGIDGVVVVAHGRSDAEAFKSAIKVAKDAVDIDLVGAIRSAFQ